MGMRRMQNQDRVQEQGLPWWLRVCESTCRCRRKDCSPGSGRPRAPRSGRARRLSCAATRPGPCAQEGAAPRPGSTPLTAGRERLRVPTERGAAKNRRKTGAAAMASLSSPPQLSRGRPQLVLVTPSPRNGTMTHFETLPSISGALAFMSRRRL